MKRLILAECLFSFVHPAAAIVFCAEPSEPTCLYMWEPRNFKMCKFEVEAYLKRWDQYVDCQEDYAKKQSNQMIDRFNCLARGESLCI